MSEHTPWEEAYRAAWPSDCDDDGGPIDSPFTSGFRSGFTHARGRHDAQRIAALEGALRDFAEHGIRHDLSPSIHRGENWLQHIDASVRERARAALGEAK